MELYRVVYKCLCWIILGVLVQPAHGQQGEDCCEGEEGEGKEERGRRGRKDRREEKV